jgi:hypothetical protein
MILTPEAILKVRHKWPPERRARSMTIAIGALCQDGLIVAADTRIVCSDGSTYDACKVSEVVTNHGAFVIANSADDGNAATTLVAQIMADFKSIDPKTLMEAEDTVINRMTVFSAAFTRQAPAIELVMGARINTIAIPSANTGGGLGLYFCSPPNTVVRKTYLDDSRGYVAAGSGASATDPIARSLFPFLPHASDRLAEIAYLMYRAKKDNAAFCGGKTNAILLRDNDSAPPVWVRPLDMAVAELNGAPLVHESLRMAASATLRPSDRATDQIVLSIAGQIADNGRFYQSLRFHAADGTEI